MDYVKRKCKAKASVLRFCETDGFDIERFSSLEEIPDHESFVFKWHIRLVTEGTKKIQTV